VNLTGIEWTWTQLPDGTWQKGYSSNPIRARNIETGKTGHYCTKVSEGCKNCWASAWNVFRGTGLAFVPQNADRVEWYLDEKELAEWRKPRYAGKRVFICDLTDLFHESVPEWDIARVFGAAYQAPELTIQILTKRSERMRTTLNDKRFWWRVTHSGPDGQRICAEDIEGPLKNVWIGVSVENHRWLHRIDDLVWTPAAVRFLSCEPLLGPLDIRYYLDPWLFQDVERSPIDWVIAGGESNGPPQRRLVERCCRTGSPFPPGYMDHTMKPNTPCEFFNRDECDLSNWRPKPEALVWARSLRDQCIAAGVPFFFKQWGGPTSKAGGAKLDGREWRQFPRTAVAV